MTNLQGNVVRIINASGTAVADYTYNAWGEVISPSSGTLASVNPLRYRGYYYDTETGLYYLNSRYYDPATCRFINADTSDTLLANPNALTDKNLFAYCDNNPVMRKDDGGEFWNFIVGGVVGALIGGVTQVVSNAISGNKNLTDGLGTAIATGAVSGVLAATGVGLLGSIAGNAFISMGGNIANQVIKNKGFKNFDVGDMLIDGVAGGIAGGFGGSAMGKAVNLTTLNRGLTNKVLSSLAKTILKGVKYYVSQTAKLYYRKLIKPIIKSAISTLATNVGKNKLYSMYA